jgi:putrescine transport system permease protein
MKRRRTMLLPTILAFGFAFLYVPILSMVVYSFNASRLVTVWDPVHSPTLKWYTALFHNAQIIDAAWLSLKIAIMNATGAVILGTMAGFALARFGPFRGRGVTTITIAHISFSLSYVAVIVQARLVGFDESLEEAALDLGARPATVFLRITLPLIAPALLSGWLLSFTLSWDDVVISQFVAGPGSSTLPMVIFSKVRLGVSPDVNALATLMVSLVAVGVVASALFVQNRERRRMREMRMALAS